MSIFVMGNSNFKRFLPADKYTYIEKIKPDQLANCKLIIIQNRFAFNEKKLISGKKIIFNLRVIHEFINPIILVHFFDNPTDNEFLSDVQQDPYIEVLHFSKLVSEYHEPKKILALFHPIQDKDDLILLYQDLKNSIYKEAGEITEIKHQLLSDLGSLNTNDFTKAFQLIMRVKIDLDRIFMHWKIKNINRETIKKEFDDCQRIADLELLKVQIRKIFERLEIQISFPNTEQRPPSTESIKVVYISERMENQNLLKEVFKKYFDIFSIECLTATNAGGVTNLINTHSDIVSVVSDYRFRESPQKIKKTNGYHLFKELKSKFPQLYFAFLSNFSEDQMISPPGFDHIDIYTKSLVFSDSPVEFFRMANTISRISRLVLSKKGLWPEKLNTKEDVFWRDVHDRLYLPHAKWLHIEKEIGQFATTAIYQTLSESEAIVHNLPQVSSALSKAKSNKLKPLIDRMKIRRVIIGLYNCTNLLDKFTHLYKDSRGQKRRKTVRKIKFEIIYQLIKTPLAFTVLPTDKELSNFYRDNFRIMLSFDYSKDNPKLHIVLTEAEFRWTHQNSF